MMSIRANDPFVVAAALGLALATPAASHAAGTGVTVQGVVIPPAKVEAPPAPRLGFLDRIENPIVELRQHDPLPECFVFLDGGPAAGDSGTPPKNPVSWQLEANSFSPPLLPVIAGSSVEIANVGRRESHLLVAVGQPELVQKDPIGPTGMSRPFTVSGKDTAVVVESRSSPHVKGRLVPVPTRYFSRIDRNGKFKIENVPPGRWMVKLWYRDGWANLHSRSIDVPAKDVKIELANDALASGAGK
jgi:hypothetical protein